MFNHVGFPSSSVVKKSFCSVGAAGDMDSFPGWGRFPGERSGYLLMFLPGEFHGQRSLKGCSPQGRKQSDTTEGT